jgi:hypothetical protein
MDGNVRRISQYLSWHIEVSHLRLHLSEYSEDTDGTGCGHSGTTVVVVVVVVVVVAAAAAAAAAVSILMTTVLIIITTMQQLS